MEIRVCSDTFNLIGREENKWKIQVGFNVDDRRYSLLNTVTDTNTVL